MDLDPFRDSYHHHLNKDMIMEMNLCSTGIAHLHEGINPSIIHRDIKPSNILVGEGFEAKVSDFGLVKMGPVGDQSHVSSQIKGTPGYLDPAYCTSYHLSPLSDVYSFGVILLQLIAARPAVDLGRNSNYHIIEWVSNLSVKASTNIQTHHCLIWNRRDQALRMAT